MTHPDHATTSGKPRRRRALLILLAIATLAIAAYAIRQWTKPDANAALPTVTVTLGDIEKTVTALGSLKPKEYVDVGTQVSGQLKKVHVEIGDRVQKGQLLAEIDPAVYKAQVDSGRANLDNLKAQLQQQEAELELANQQNARSQRLLAARAVSQDEAEQAASGARVSAAKRLSTLAQIRASEAELARNTTNLGYTKIHAPMSGTVVSQTSLEGQTVNASQSAPVIVQIANLDTMTVWAQVAEADIVKLKTGMTAYFTTLGMPERRWYGTVRQIQPTPETVNDVVLYNVLIDAENDEQLLMPTMTVQVFFVIGEAKDVPTLPVSALKETPRGHIAMVPGKNGPEPRRVKVGLSNRNVAEIVSGLAEGDKVLASVPARGNRPAGAGQRDGAGGERRQGMGPGGPGMGPRL